MAVTDTPKVEPLAHSPARASQRIGIPERAVYAHIATGELLSFKIGKRRLITDEECKRLVQRREAQAAKG